MSFTDIANSSTTSPTDMNDNFLWVAQGSALPMAGDRMANTSATQNIGSATYKFRTLYCDNLIISSNTADASGMNLLWTKITEIVTTTSRIEITGLNGDSTFVYDMFSKISGPPTAAGLYLYFNGDSSTANYYRGYHVLTASGYYDGAATLTMVINYINSSLGSDDFVSFGKTSIYTKTGSCRKIINSRGLASGSKVYMLLFQSALYINTTTTITSLVLQSTPTATAIDMSLWRRG